MCVFLDNVHVSQMTMLLQRFEVTRKHETNCFKSNSTCSICCRLLWICCSQQIEISVVWAFVGWYCNWQYLQLCLWNVQMVASEINAKVVQTFSKRRQAPDVTLHVHCATDSTNTLYKTWTSIHILKPNSTQHIGQSKLLVHGPPQSNIGETNIYTFIKIDNYSNTMLSEGYFNILL